MAVAVTGAAHTHTPADTRTHPAAHAHTLTQPKWVCHTAQQNAKEKRKRRGKPWGKLMYRKNFLIYKKQEGAEREAKTFSRVGN